jgi:PhzF family phenazine biosynthesis protein
MAATVLAEIRSSVRSSVPSMSEAANTVGVVGVLPMACTLGQDGEVALPLFQIDAFSDALFGGNPAAVMPLAAWLDDDVMQRIAMENNLSETAYLVPRVDDGPDGPPAGAGADDPRFDLRWFTPSSEIALCGHATLASGWLVLNELLPQASAVHFHTLSGWLSVSKGPDGQLSMDFPAREISRTDIPEGAAEALGAPIVAAWKALDNIMFIVDDETTVAEFAVDLATIRQWTDHLLIVTAPASAAHAEAGIDFVSRVFAPGVGVGEDPVTGAAHTMLTPYWSKRLNQTKLVGRQISARGGTLWLEDRKERVTISGYAVLYLTGSVHL